MFEGRCPNRAHLVVDTLVPIGNTFEPLSWYVCDALTCMVAAQAHAEKHHLIHVDTRRITPADFEAITGRVEVAA